MISFGDFMLPLVGLVAIGLLLIAGKIFFFSDFQPDSPPIPKTVAPPVIPKTPRADAGEGVSVSKPPSEVQPVTKPQPPSRGTGGNLVLDLAQNNTQNNVTQDKPGVAPNNSNRNGTPQSNAGREEIIVVQTPPPPPREQPQASQPQARPAQTPPRPALQPRPSQRPVSPKPVESKPAQPEKPAAQPDKPNWMVQVGAFSTPSAAETVLERVTKTGHTAAVFSGKTLHRVLVQAGPTKQDALNLATKLGHGEFPGAFVVPPRP